MKLLISGSSGLIGGALCRHFESNGHDVLRLVRQPSDAADEVFWSPETGALDGAIAAARDVDAIIHLAGENIAARRWTAAQKQKLRTSRVEATEKLCAALQAAGVQPATFVQASAIGYYGDRADEQLSEDSAPGSGFLPDLCRAWEHAASAYDTNESRACALRFGLVLSGEGGALGKMLLPFKLGLGGRIGDGKQFMSWIALDDAVRAIEHILNDTSIRGPVNMVAPAPVTNAEFTRALGRALGRPTVLPLPAFVARIVLGELADGLLLASVRVEPAVLTRTKFEFKHPLVLDALQHVLAQR